MAMEILHPSHEDPLSFSENSKSLCKGCLRVISPGTPAYICESCSFQLHKSCSDLPHEIQHPLHPPHPLTLLHQPPYYRPLFVCDGCRSFSSGFAFHCETCRFSLDVACATEMENPNRLPLGQREKTMKTHTSHKHMLTLGEVCGESTKAYCSGCELPLSGRAYGCESCGYILHETCMNIQQELKHPFHPKHPLLASNDLNKETNGFSGRLGRLGREQVCDACFLDIRGMAYQCPPPCDFNLHIHCANSPAVAIKHRRHRHPLVYFRTEDFSCFSERYGRKETFTCRVCYEECTGSFFRCVECNFDVHFGCVPIPPTVKYKRHIHPLNLVDSVVEEDCDEYYCDDCECRRNPEHAVYYCEECKYVAHINCVISESQEDVSVLDVEEGKELMSPLGRKYWGEEEAEGGGKSDIITEPISEEFKTLMEKIEGIVKKMICLQEKLEPLKQKRDFLAKIYYN